MWLISLFLYRFATSAPVPTLSSWSRYVAYILLSSIVWTNHNFLKAPVQVFGLEGRYASALYSAASKQKSLEKVEKELKDFQATVGKDARLAEFIANPTLKRSLKKDALAAVAKKLNLSAVTGNLLRKSTSKYWFRVS